MHLAQHFALHSLQVRILFLCLHWLIYYVTYNFLLKLRVVLHRVFYDFTQTLITRFENPIPKGLHGSESLCEPLAIALHDDDDEGRFGPLLRSGPVLDKVALFEVEDFKE